MKSGLPLSAVAVSLVISAGVLTWRNVSVFARSQRPPTPVAMVADWRRYAETGVRIGAKFPSVNIIEFVDYSCRACKNFAPYLDNVLRNHPSEVALIVKHLPILGQPSRAAAKAAVCASQQGWLEPYHRLLMNQQTLSIDSLVPFASRVGVADTTGFRNCMGSEASGAILTADSSDADRLGVAGVPAILVNGELYSGGQPKIEAVVVRHLKARKVS